jgi:hypothetical protein
VGAPKCGTSALYDFLRQHAELFLPREKELLFFGTDLSYPTRLSEDEFLAHFAERGSEQVGGTSHTAYLQSRSAAHEIHERRPDARIIVMLRNPVEMLHSWHSELLYQTIEDIHDFEAALDAEPDRRAGRRIPRNARNSYVESLFYTDVAAFASQVERYLEVFGRSQVHVVLQDDLRADTAQTFKATLRFLGVDADFTPDFGVVNPNKVVKSRVLQGIYFATAIPGHRIVRNLLPRPVRRSLLAMNVRQEPRRPLEPQVEERLERRFRGEVERLGELLERDLSGWLRAESREG